MLQRKILKKTNEEKIFFKPGDTVTFRQNISNKPTMLVKRIDRVAAKNVEELHNNLNMKLFGIQCMWFDADMKVQMKSFNSKDLVKVKDEKNI